MQALPYKKTDTCIHTAVHKEMRSRHPTVTVVVTVLDRVRASIIVRTGGSETAGR